MVAEGERVRLIASYNLGFNDALSQDPSRYSWRQSVGDALKFNDALSPVDTQSAILDFTIPSDVVAKQDDRRTVQLIMEIAVNDDVYLSTTLPLIISKRDNDTATRVRLLRDNNKANTYNIRFEREDGSDFVDRDGGFAETNIQWQRRRSDTESWVNVGSGSPYTLPNNGNHQYRALVVYEDNQGYRAQLESEVIDYLDIDDDGDGLIEIAYLEELDAIRHQPDGSGYKATASAAKITVGCPLVRGRERCRGYELVRDLDFNDPDSYALKEINRNWMVADFNITTDTGWQPIGGTFNAVFNGNGYTISNMQINRSVGNQSHIGLFSQIGVFGRLRNLGLVNPEIKGLVGNKNVGGIAGSIQRGSVIMNSYVVGDVADGNTNKIIRGDVEFASQIGFIGGLVGWNRGLILNSYAKINVVAEDSGTASNKRVRVGGLVGRNIDGGKVYNSYATGEVKGPCIVGGLVGNQFSTDPTELVKTSEIKNSYAAGNVATGFGACVNANNQAAGGLVGFNNRSRVENGYTLGEVSGGSTLAGLVARRFPTGDTSIANPVNSYWNYNANCNMGSRLDSDNNIIAEVFCYQNNDTPAVISSDARIDSGLQFPTMPNVNDEACIEDDGSTFSCMTYVDWDIADWDFGTDEQYPAIKYGVGLNTSDPGCDKDSVGYPETGLPSCDALLPGQIDDALLLNSLSLSSNSREVQLTPSFGANRFNYEAVIESEILPVVINIAANAATDTAAITIRRDGGSPLTKRPDGSVQISAYRSFNLGIETASGNNRGANYQIYVRLPQIHILRAVNGSTPTELITRNISVLDEGDVLRLDAATSVGRNNRGLDYQWTQVSGKPLLSEIQTTSTLEFTLPADFVALDDSHSTVVLKLELIESGNPTPVLSREIPLSVRKINNGNSASAVKWISSDTLSASDLSEDVDGGVLGDIDYQWLREQNGMFVTVPSANQRSYTPREDARNAQYRLSINYTDAQGYETNIHYDAPRYTAIANFVDKDNDGLIEIETLEDLDAIRYQLDGSGYRASSATNKITAGCPADQCKGYELVKDLDFLDDANYVSTRNKVVWTMGAGWQPIGTITNDDCSDSGSNCFNGIFDGNGYSVSNLRIHRPSTNNIALFAGNTGTIHNLGLSAIEVRGNSRVGSLVGRNEGELMNVYVAGGRVTGQNQVIGSGFVGGICGINSGSISNSYAVVDVSALRDAGGLVAEHSGSINNSYVAGLVSISQRQQAVGGLVGILEEGGSVSNSYSTAEVEVTFEIQSNNDEQRMGGLIGSRQSSELIVANSYWDIETSEQVSSAGGTSKTTVQLQTPTTATAIYADWSSDDWDFGTSEQYPALKYYDNTCGTSTPSPDCGKLLLYQRVGLRDLRLEQNVGAGNLSLSPDFDPAVTTYTVSVDADASELRIIPIAANPDAIIVADGKVLPASNAGYAIALNTSGATSTTIRVAARNSMAAENAIVYKLTVNDNRLPKISLNAPASIREGETLVLDATIEDSEGDELSYSLSMTPNLNICRGRLVCPPVTSIGTVVGRADLRYEFDIPSDLLSEMQSTTDVDIVLTVDDGSNVVSEMVRLTIVKENNGVISLSAPTLNDFTYTIDVDLSSDSDGVNPTPEIAYQWQRELLGSWSNIDDATDASYTAEGIIGGRYRVLVDYIDKQGYRHQGILSPAVSAPQQFNVEVFEDVLIRPMIELVANGLVPTFGQDTTEYTVPSSTTKVQVIVIAEEGQTVSINDMPLAGEETQKTILLDFGNNEIIVVAKGENNSTQSYTIFREFGSPLYRWSVKWQGPSTQTLSFLGSNLDSDPPARIPNNIDSVLVTATVGAMMQVDISSAGNTVGLVTTSTEGRFLFAQATIDDLALGENAIEFLLTAPDSSTTSYTAKVWRRYNSRLTDLSAPNLSPPLPFDSERFDYTLTVSNHIRAVTLNFEAHEGATVFVQGASALGNSVSVMVSDIGENIVPIRVTAPREEDTVYTLSITRQHSLNLRSLDVTNVSTMTTVDLSPPFATTGTRIYDAEVLNETSQVRVTFATDLGVDSRLSAPTTPTISERSILNDDSDDRIETTALLPLNFDKNLITIRTLALGMEQVTTLTIVRPESDDAKLMDLQILDLNNINLLPDFASSTQDYTLTVSNSTTEIQVVATTHPFAKIKLDITGEEDITTATGTISNKFELRETGMENQLRIRIVVTAQNGSITQGYTVLVTRLDLVIRIHVKVFLEGLFR